MITAVLLAALLIAIAAAGLLHVSRSIRRARHVLEDARNEAAYAARVRAIACPPCGGGSGRCTCGSKCGHWLCGAADTGVMTIDDEYRELLRRETGK